MADRRNVRQARRALAGAAAVLAALAVSAPAVGATVTPWAGTATSLTTPCDGQTIEQPFRPWWDRGNYVLAPNGGLEDGSFGWSLSGGAAVVRGNEPFYVHAATDRRSLSLPAGSSATTPATCVGLLYPYIRLFASGASTGALKVEVVYNTYRGETRAMTIAYVVGGDWRPTRRIAFLPSSTIVRSETGNAVIAFRFTSLGASFQIDDVYVDPFVSR